MSEYITVWVDDLPDLKRKEEITRCRDCDYYEYREHAGRSYCCGEYSTEPDGFCKWGEPRGESE